MRQKMFDIFGFPRLCLIILNKNLTFYSVNLTFYSVVKVCNNNVQIIIDLHFDMNLAAGLETVGVWDAPRVIDISGFKVLCGYLNKKPNILFKNDEFSQNF